MKTKLFLLLLLISSLTFAQFPTNGLISEYSFTGGSLVDGANGINFTQTGAALTTVNDRFVSVNNAINTNGDYLTRTDINYLNSGDYRDIGTVSFWIKTTTNTSDPKVIIDDSDRSNISDAEWAGYHIYLKDGKVGVSVMVRYSTYHGYRGFGVLSSQIISDGNWHHVAMTMNNRIYFSGSVTVVSASVALYIDGVAAGNTGVSNSSTGSIYLTHTNDSPGNVTIANNRGNNFPTINRYEDTIDDVLFYGRSLSPAEIESIANYNYCFAIDSSTIAISNKTTTSFDVSWQEDGDFELAYVLNGQPLANATVITVNGYTSGSLENISGLTEGTLYDIYIREICTVNTYSAWSNALPARTLGKIFVKADATGANNGNSWADAYTDLQDALAVAENNQEIWVAQGTYYPNPTDRTIYYEINKVGTTIYGGFDGTETQLSQRDFRTNLTIFSGDLLGNDNANIVLNESTRSDNSAKLFYVNANNFTLDGVTVTGGEGYVAGNTFYDSGTAITKEISKINLTIDNCILKNNTAYRGAACVLVVYNTSGFLKVSNSIFSNNSAAYGTSFYSYTAASSTVLDVDITNCLFNNNTVTDIGSYQGFAGSAGWFRAYNSGSTVLASFVNNTYTNNTDAGTGGGLNNFTRATLGLGRTSGNMVANVDNCIFYNNKASGTATAKSITGVISTLGNITVSNAIDEDGFSGISSANTTNISTANPLFVDSTNDFTLQAGSPAIDSGDNSKVPAVIQTDLLGNVRIYNTTVDMGCYEYGAPVFTTYTLTTNVNGNGTVSPNGTTTHTSSAIVSVTATPATGWQFDHWTGDESGNTNPLSVTMDADKSIEAVFTQIQRTLTTTVNGNGTVLPNGTNTYNDGDMVTVTATPATGWQFDHWTGDASGNTNPLSVTMDADKSIEAVFTQIQRTLATFTNGSGAVSPTGVTTYNDGTSVSVSAMASVGWQFDNWSGDASGTTSPINVVMDADKNIVANFSQIQYELTLVSNAGGTALPDSGTLTGGVYHYVYGTNVNITATANTGYVFDYFNITDASGTVTINTSNPVMINMSENFTVEPIFIQQVTLDVSVSGNGTTTPSGQTTYNLGESVTLNAIAGTGYVFDHWQFSGGASSIQNPYTISMNSDVTIQAVFIPIQVTLNMTQYGTGATVSPAVGNTTFNYGDSVTVSANVNAGWEVTSAIINNNPYTLPYTFTITANTNVIITVAQIQKTLTTIAGANGSISPSGTNTYNYGDSVTIAATPNTNYSLVRFDITDSNGTTTSATNPLTIVMNDDITVEAIFDLTNTVSEETLHFSMYPNPATTILTVKMDNDFKLAIIFDSLGRKILESKTNMISISNLSIGMYLIKVQDSNGNIAIKKFIKR